MSHGMSHHLLPSHIDWTESASKRDIRCRHGLPVEAIEITTVSDARPRYMAGQCDCPRPHCPFCHIELTPDGRCNGGLNCFFDGLLVPEPDVY